MKKENMLEEGFLPTPGRVPPVTTLGVGWSTDNEMATSFACINGNTKFGEGGTTIIKFNDTKTFSEITNIVTHQAHGGVNISAFIADAGESYLRSINETTYSEAFYYSYEIIFPPKIYTPVGFGADALTPIGLGAYKAGPAQFRESCGDYYISEEVSGAALVASMKIDFHSLSEKKDFSAHIKVGFEKFVDISASIKEAYQETKIDGTLDFSVMQIGGDGSQLSKIMGKDPSGSYHITSCSLKQIDECHAIVTDVFNYADNNFSKQVAYSNGTITGTVNQLNFSVTPAAAIVGVDHVGPSVITPAIIEARINLTNLQSSIQNDQVFIQHIVDNCLGSGDQATKEELENLNGVLNGNMNIVMNSYTGAIDCWFDPLGCLRTEETIYATMQPANTSILGDFSIDCGPSESSFAIT